MKPVEVVLPSWFHTVLQGQYLYLYRRPLTSEPKLPLTLKCFQNKQEYLEQETLK